MVQAEWGMTKEKGKKKKKKNQERRDEGRRGGDKKKKKKKKKKKTTKVCIMQPCSGEISHKKKKTERGGRRISKGVEWGEMGRMRRSGCHAAFFSPFLTSVAMLWPVGRRGIASGIGLVSRAFWHIIRHVYIGSPSFIYLQHPPCFCWLSCLLRSKVSGMKIGFCCASCASAFLAMVWNACSTFNASLALVSK